MVNQFQQINKSMSGTKLLKRIETRRPPISLPDEIIVKLQETVLDTRYIG